MKLSLEESNAPLDSAIKALESLGFTPLSALDSVMTAESDCAFMSKTYKDGSIDVRLYKCRSGYYCADIEGGYRAPVVWLGKRAAWDNSTVQDDINELKLWLHEEFPGWDD